MGRADGEFRRHRNEGRRLSQQREFAKALVELERARAIEENAEILVEIGMVYVGWGGHAREALRACTAFYQQTGAKDAKLRLHADRCISEANQQLDKKERKRARREASKAAPPLAATPPALIAAAAAVPAATTTEPMTPMTHDERLIPAGTFVMGSNAGNSNERPVHEVSVAAFYLARTEVTVAAYARCEQAGRCDPARRGGGCNAGQPERGRHPINCVSYEQAQSYCEWLGKRLPTEEEWEYAARGAEGRKYPWGSGDPDRQLCWRQAGSCEVGSYPDGLFGLQDLAGNMREWTASEYHQDYSTGPAPCMTQCVTRGGSWADAGKDPHRSTYRSHYRVAHVASDLGFRCAGATP